ncbi:TPA: fimbrial protein [Klebsiella variicola]|nr:fimbrial protein [Klebsiella variicola]
MISNKYMLIIFLKIVTLIIFAFNSQNASAWGCDNKLTGETNLISATINVYAPIASSLQDGYNEVARLNYLECASSNYSYYKDKVYISTMASTSVLTGVNVIVKMKGTSYKPPMNNVYYGEGYGRYPSELYPMDIQVGFSPVPGSTGQVVIKKGDIIAKLRMYIQANCCAQTNTINIIANNDAVIPLKGCNVTGSGTQTVNMSPITKNEVVNQGKVNAGSKTFDLVFDCPANAPISVTPTGTALIPDQGVYANTSTGTGAAKNIGVAMECADQGGQYMPLIPSSKISLGSTTVDGLTNRTCKASYYSLGSATEGNVSATTTLSFVYN